MLRRIGTWLTSSVATGEVTTGARISLAGSSVAEDAAIGTAIGTLSVVNGSGVYTFSITADPDSKFAIDGTTLETAAALDYETATSHSVTIEADNGVDTPLSRTFVIGVTDVSEPTGPTNGIQLETGDFLLAENGDYLIQEAA
jgi:hypothetical protein